MRPVVFLDIDDVIATGDVWTSSWVIRSFRPGGRPFEETEWRTVFSDEACQHLSSLHDQVFPLYVISSSWSNYLTRDDIQLVFEKTGLSFVGSHLHEDWTTPKISSLDRCAEISAWLADHPEVTNFVVLDDENSGHTLRDSDLHRRTVFCTTGVGFDNEKFVDASRILSVL